MHTRISVERILLFLGSCMIFLLALPQIGVAGHEENARARLHSGVLKLAQQAETAPALRRPTGPRMPGIKFKPAPAPAPSVAPARAPAPDAAPDAAPGPALGQGSSLNPIQCKRLAAIFFDLPMQQRQRLADSLIGCIGGSVNSR